MTQIPTWLAALEVELADPERTVILLHHHPRWGEPAHVRAVLYGHQHVEHAEMDAGGCHWLASGKSTDLVEGRLSYRTLDLDSGQLQTVTIPGPA